MKSLLPAIMKRSLFLLVCLSTLFGAARAGAQDDSPKPIRALLIAGGCCHDYARQQEVLSKGIQALANVRVDVYWTDNSSTTPQFPLFDDPKWFEQYDVIIHDECAADVKDEALVKRVIDAHQKIPAVHLHCAMHSFRTGGDAWFKHLGLQSSSHGPQRPIKIEFVDAKHPITETLSDWTTINEELYNNVKLFGAHPLAKGKQSVGRGDRKRVNEAVVAWTNESEGARSFSTTIGHNTETVQDPRYLELVTRGLLWACGKLTPEYMKPYTGENEVTFIDKTKVKAPVAMDPRKPPADATLVKLKASSTQSGHPSYQAIDGDVKTRWCADGGSFPQSLQIEFEKPIKVREIQITWESAHWYRYQVEGSSDGKDWSMLLDKSDVSQPDSGSQKLANDEAVKFLRITGLAAAGGWCSIREIKLQGESITTLWQALADADSGEFVPELADQYAKQGNTIPRIETLTPEQEAEILQDVHVPEGFDVTVFAAPPAVNYPVFVASSVDGTVYVSSDGNGSLGRNPKRGRVIRLRDLDGDGRADETKIFCEVDAPRGLVWDHDRLYVMHPPHLSEFIDRDGDGVAEEQNILVKNLAFDYDKRPADHTTNGLSLGADGWLYIAGGDFGFMDAEGTDGRKLTHRGGGVIRVRPDGTGLEVYSTGTRNILEVAISPSMEMFARDNTNDGGGWDVRLHHFTGGEDHGYPRLYKNFGDECVAPLADYGGGSGCGAVYIDEPGFGDWNDAPFTADWGTGSLYRHTVTPQGATYEETAPPKSFIKMTRPTDADVDGNSRVYCASWRGATFDWEGPDVGYLVCVTPKDFQPEPMPDFAKASEDELIELLQTESYRRRIEAQRELMRRDNPQASGLLEQGVAKRNEQRKLLEHLQTDATDVECVAALGSDDPVVVHTAVRCLAQRGAWDACFQSLDQQAVPTQPILRALAMMHESPVVEGLVARLSSADNAEMRQLLLAALCRLHFLEGQWKGDSWGTRPDTRGPYYQPEAWSETGKIAAVLKESLEEASPAEASFLLSTMHSNRISIDDSLTQLLAIAESNDQLLTTVLAQLAARDSVPDEAVDLLLKAAEKSDLPPAAIAHTVIALAKTDARQAPVAMLSALTNLGGSQRRPGNERRQAVQAFLNAAHLDTQVEAYLEASQSEAQQRGLWADAALLTIAAKGNGSPEAKEHAGKAIEAAWNTPARRQRLVQAAMRSNSHLLDKEIWNAREDADPEVARAARSAIRRLRIEAFVEDDSPKLNTMETQAAIETATAQRGNRALGEQVFTRANCVACHTVREDQPGKGPYLGNIAKTYKRKDLATAILDPSKTLAQGFTTTVILNSDGQVKTGFVTQESSDQVTMRDQEGKEFTILKEDIEQRQSSPISVMPSGVLDKYTVHELASLLDYLESLAAISAAPAKQ